jgi:hypothetical protein
MTNDELLSELDFLRNTLISVSTGGDRIQEVNQQYKLSYLEIDKELRKRKIPNPIKYWDLWEWHGRWGAGDLPSWGSRRLFISEVFNPLLDSIQNTSFELPEPTGWERVDRVIAQVQTDLSTGSSEEQFQVIGTLCREVIITLAQQIYDPVKYPTVDVVEASETDAKRMLEGYIAVELKGGGNDETRKFARTALDLANHLQHHRTATFRDAALCFEATKSIVNVIAILDGRRG